MEYGESGGGEIRGGRKWLVEEEDNGVEGKGRGRANTGRENKGEANRGSKKWGKRGGKEKRRIVYVK